MSPKRHTNITGMPEQSTDRWVLEQRVFDLMFSYDSEAPLRTYPVMQ